MILLMRVFIALFQITNALRRYREPKLFLIKTAKRFIRLVFRLLFGFMIDPTDGLPTQAADAAAVLGHAMNDPGAHATISILISTIL
jgi:hypothetical protein